MYRENMTEVRTPLLPQRQVDGTLIPHIIPDYTTDQEYISRIPNYSGNTIPPILTRPKSLRSHEWNYFNLKSFLQNFGQHDESESWVVAGLLAETGSISDVPIAGQIKAIFKHSNEDKCKKLLLCKKSKDKIVFLINVTDSKKEEGGLQLNERYLDSIMIIDASTLNPPRPDGYEHMPLPPMAVPHQRQRAADEVEVKIFKLSQEDGSEQLQQEKSTYLRDIMRTLSDNDTYVIDPNKIDSQSAVTVEWFGDMTLEGINGLIEKTIPQLAPQPERGGKIRSSKPRVTKTRKSTKRRRQQRRRRTSRK
jgi:hypothetical protein